MTLTGKNIVGSQLSAKGDSVFYAVNPSTGQKMEPAFVEAASQEIDSAIRQASAAFQIYRTRSGKERAAFLETIASEILSLGEDLITRCKEETGLPEARLIGERGRTVNQLKLFAELLREGSWVEARIDTADPNRQPLPRQDIRSMLKAIGPVAVFGASNFPFAFSVAGGDTASALAAGCTVVVKGHPAHPGTSEMVGLAIQRAVVQCDLPEGTFSMLNGTSVEVGLGMVQHPLIKAVGFTGSFQGGKSLFDAAARRSEPIPVFAEMGSSNPVFILPGALAQRKEALAQGLSASVTLGVGQFCTNPGLVFLQESAGSASFKELLAQNIKESNGGVMLTSGICQNYGTGIEKARNIQGVEVVAKGKEKASSCHGTSYLMTASAQSFLNEPALQEEVFGPSTLLVTGQHQDELIEAAKSLHGHLTVSIHGTEEDLRESQDLVTLLEQKAGRLIINDYPTGVEVCHAMVHGGPYPATTDSRSTSVGTAAIKRFVRPVCYQGFPSTLLPDELKDDNPMNIWRLVDGQTIK